MANASRRDVEARDRVKVLRLPAVLAPAVERARLNLPDDRLAILACRSDDGVIERRPISVQNGTRVASREWDEIRELGREAVRKRSERRGKGKDSERASTGGVPVQGNVSLQDEKVVGAVSGTVVNTMYSDCYRSRTVEPEMTLVSQALLVTLTLSKPYSFLPFWPKTWLFAV